MQWSRVKYFGIKEDEFKYTIDTLNFRRGNYRITEEDFKFHEDPDKPLTYSKDKDLTTIHYIRLEDKHKFYIEIKGEFKTIEFFQK